MAAFIRRALSLPASATDFFTDDDGSTFEDDINAIAEAGITIGCNPPANDMYCPGSVVYRGQMAALLRRALSLPASATDFFTDDDDSIFEDDINAIAEAGITLGCNPPANDLFCTDDVVRRDAMASFLARAFGYPEDVPPARPPLDWELVVSGLSSPVQVLAPPGEDRLMIVQQGGLVRVFESGSVNSTPFLDITGDVIFSGERGLLAIAFHPDYPADRRMFAWYVGNDGDTYLVEYDIAADLESAASPRTVLEIDQPASNHNGGFLAFGDDGYLYLSTGDGGGGNNSHRTARDLDSLLGKILRLDVDGGLPYDIPGDNPYVGASGRDEIWASGLRNPWRWSFGDGYMFIGDVGQGSREEIDAVPIAPVGYDFGWSRYEGSVCNPNDFDPSCSTSGLTFPVAEYSHSVGQTVIGGILYEGPTVRSLTDYYLYADIYSGVVRGFRIDDGDPVEAVDLSSEIGMSGIVSFGEDADGELLVVSLFNDAVYRLTGG
jgi:glucose/arabinose dehydrogenase